MVISQKIRCLKGLKNGSMESNVMHIFRGKFRSPKKIFRVDCGCDMISFDIIGDREMIY
jgi:hypothetical protein